MNSWPVLRASAVVLLMLVVVSASQKSRPKTKSGKLVLAFKTETPDLPAKVNQTAAVIKNRCLRFRIRCNIQTQNKDNANQLLISFSSLMDLDRVKGLLLGEGLLVRSVASQPFPAPLREYDTRAQAIEAAGENEVFPLTEVGDEKFIVVEGSPILTADDLRDCVALKDGSPLIYNIDCRLRPQGAARLEAWTGVNINRYMAVLYNGKAISVGYVIAPISLNMEISGFFGRQHAREIANILETGNLPAPFDIVHEETSP